MGFPRAPKWRRILLNITVIGLGYVGAVAAAGLANAGHDVLGVDIDRIRVNSLSAGNVPIYEPGLEAGISAGLAHGNLRFSHPDDICEPLGDIALIATGTPPRQSGAADLSQVRSALQWIKSKPHDNLLVVMKSTVPPGTGCRLLSEDLGGSRMRYASNPEFLREGQAVADWDSPDRIVIGAEPGDNETIDAVKKMHDGISAPFVVTDITSAEMTKYASNAFLATRISFINEIASLCERVGASIDAVSEGLAMDPRTGSKIYAGVGYGGSCFPKDVRALDYLALTSGVNFELLRSVINVNNKQRLLPLYALRSRFGGAISGLRVGVLGLAFKPETDDVRDAPSLDLIRALVDEGVEVQAFDPRATHTAARELPSSALILDDPVEASAGAHALVLLTEWEQIVKADWKDVARCMRPPRFVFDGRNCLSPQAMDMIGFEYHSVGRNNQPNPFV
ncbi:MAG: UDP-glucose/GDP-mannose dehydrogenase family protein [Dehalococcoidia bacterium]|nr:UDP-glucose/GDP-mannose dehydrogenase family protein [Dehalococcoidia bacterium]